MVIFLGSFGIEFKKILFNFEVNLDDIITQKYKKIKTLF